MKEKRGGDGLASLGGKLEDASPNIKSFPLRIQLSGEDKADILYTSKEKRGAVHLHAARAGPSVNCRPEMKLLMHWVTASHPHITWDLQGTWLLPGTVSAVPPNS